MQIWLISDTHFGHQNIYKFVGLDGVTRIRARFRDAHEGDAYMIQRWCELVKPQDHIWHLGDVTMERSSAYKAQFVNMIRGLPGHKRLILGNHDHLTLDVYRDAGFQKIKGSHKLNRLLLTHYPVHPDSVPMWCAANIHGHIHERSSPVGRYINVSVERTNYEPIPLEEVEAKALRLMA